MLFNIFLLLCGVQFCVCAKVDNEVTIGGLFHIFDEEYNLDQDHIEHLNAFILAINEINANLTLLPNHTLKYAIRSPRYVETASVAALDLLKISDLAGVVSSLSSDQAKISTSIFGDNQVMTVHSMVKDTEFNIAQLFPYNAQVHPIESFEGMVLQSILCDMGLTRVTVFSGDNLFGSMYHMELFDGTFCTLEQVARFTFYDWEDNFDSAISQSQQSGGTVFLIFFRRPERIAKLVHDAFDQGLFREGTQVFLIRDDFIPYLPADVSSADVASMLAGSMVVKYDPTYSLYQTTTGEHLLTAFPLATDIACSDTDSTGHAFIVGNGTCAALNHSDFGNGTRNLTATAALTYDAMYTLALGLHYAYMRDNSGILNGTLIREAIFSDVHFIGATGFIDIHSGAPELDYYGHGAREHGNYYQLLNFNKARFDANNSLLPFSQVKVWSDAVGLFDCPAVFNCPAIVYNTRDNTMPSAYPDYAHDQAPAVIKIGGLFAPFGVDGTINVQQAEHLEAFLMAVEDVNNKTDGLFDDLLPGTKVVFSSVNDAANDVRAVAGADYFFNSFFNSHVVGVVSALPSQQSSAADLVLAEERVFVSFSEANATEFADPEVHPLGAHTNVVVSFSGMVMQQILCYHFDIKKVTVFHTSNKMGTRSAVELGDQTYCPLTKESVHQFLSGSRDFVNEFDRVKEVGSRVFTLLMGPKDAAAVLEEGHAAGLFGEGTMVFLEQADRLFDYFSPGVDVPAIMHGVFAISYFPDFSVQTSPFGQNFHERFIHRDHSVADFDCSFEVDDNQAHRLFQNSRFTTCAALNFTQYRTGERQMAPWTGNTYDATIVLLQGINRVLNHDPNYVSGSAVTADMIDPLMQDFSFVGATGPVSIYEGMVEFGGFGKGTREDGVHFRLLNFQKEAYLADPSNGMVLVDIVASSTGIIPCPASMHCYSPTYNTNDNSVPKDTKPTVHMEMAPAAVGMLMFFGTLILIFSLFLLQMIFTHRNTRHIKNSQGSLLYFIVVGGLLGGVRTILGALPVTDITCVAEVWTGHLAFALIFGAVVVKSYRLHMIFKTIFLKSSVTTERCLLIVSGGLLFVVVYLVVLTVVGQPVVAHERVVVSNQTFDSAYCGMVVPAFQTVWYALEMVFLIYGFKLAYELKDIPDKYNESTQNMDSIALVAFSGVIVFPLMYLAGMDAISATVLSSILIGLVMLALLTLLFGLKILKVYKMVGIKIYSRSTKSLMQEDAALVTFPANIITDDEKFEYCHAQIELLQGALIEIGRDDSTQGGSSANRSQSSQSSQDDGAESDNAKA